MVSRWLWPTKMPTKMASSHSKICDLVRGRKVGCSSLNAKKQGVSARVASKLWKHESKPHFDRFLQQICKPCKYSYCDDTFEKQVVIPVSPLQNLISDNFQGALQENRPRRKRTKDVRYMMLLGCGLQKDLNQKGSANAIIRAWNRSWSVIFDDVNLFCLMIFMRYW